MTMCDQCDMSTAAAAAIMPHASCQPQHRRHAHHRTTRRRRAVSPCTRAPVLPLPLPLPQRISVNDRNGQLQKRKEVEIYICCIEMSLRVTYVSRVTKTSSYSLAVPVPVIDFSAECPLYLSGRPSASRGGRSPPSTTPRPRAAATSCAACAH